MSLSPTLMSRSPSADSSALSNIDVGGNSVTNDLPPASTPPTSVSDVRSMHEDSKDAEETPKASRPRRSLAGPTTYNLTRLSNAQQSHTGRKRQRTDDDAEDDEDTPRKAARTEKLGQAVTSAASVSKMSKRVKDASALLARTTHKVLEAGKRKLGMGGQAGKKAHEDVKRSKLLKELETGSRSVLDELDLDASYPVPGSGATAKRSKKETVTAEEVIVQPASAPAGPLQKTSDGKRVKKWQDAGLYVGQNLAGDATRLKKRPSGSTTADLIPRQPLMPLPMYSYLESSRNFTIPFDIFAPTLKKGDEKPKDWHKINRNRLVGEAKELWHKGDHLPFSVCVCCPPDAGEQSCGDTCLNRVMHYECNADNCCLPESQCSNRAFTELAARFKKGGAYDIGVEVVKTVDGRGFGIRAARSFNAGQIIMEYTGEIISEGECQRRMREDYKDKQCYYLMELERNLVIDGTKGSMARFINHSCDPNCEVRMTKVNGTPRMAVYAGDAGIMTGEELTYDYNFDNFGETRQKCYCGAKTCRGYLSKRLNATEQKKQLKEEEERRRLAAIAAQKAAVAEAKKKQVKDSRGSNWRGWVAVDDAEVKEQLRAEKRAKEEAEKSSSRALRLAARASGSSGDLKAKASTQSLGGSTDKISRRRTTGNLREDSTLHTTDQRATDLPSKKRRQPPDVESKVFELPETPLPKKHRRASPTQTIEDIKTEGTASPTRTTTVKYKTTKTSVTLDVQEVEIREETSTKKGKLSSVKSFKQSTLNFARVSHT